MHKIRNEKLTQKSYTIFARKEITPKINTKTILIPSVSFTGDR